jgi:hypothetical protein
MATEITQIDIQDFISQTYEGTDISLLSQFEINNTFTPNSYIEYFIYDNNKNILSTDYSFTEYTILNDGQSAGNNNNLSQIEINPSQSLINSGYDQGEYITYFNILNKQVGSELQQLYIAEISSDRTEIRLDSTSLTNIDIVEQANNFIKERENSTYFLDFYLNFGDNQLFIANNISLDNLDVKNPTILIKLYEPLSDEFNVNSTLWVVTFVEEPIAYKVTFEDAPIIFTDTVSIGGPNFNLELKDQINNSSLELSYADLVLTSLTSSTNQLNSLLEGKEIDINVDYTDFSNFVHFSSAQSRIENFYYKVGLIESYSSSIATLSNTTNNNPSSSIAIYESKINNIITNFDGYDYYLYYYSGSSAWPKTNTSPPYQLESTNSNAVLTWLGSDDEANAYYGGILLSASLYDNLNQNNLFYTIPEYLREDPANDPYQLFIEMVGQHYDNIFIYYKDVTQKYNADNRLENGISKDIVADAIRDFGIKLYQNNFSNEDLYTAFLGLTPEGSLFPFPNITGSLPTPTGYEYIDTKISASNDYLPLDDVNKSLYKRIYHNLPYLLQTKGTLPGLRALITSYGIPDTILRIKEYGGKDKVNTNDWDYWQNEFNYAYKQNGDNFISSSFVLNSSWGANSNNPETVMFRFKTNGLPTSSIPFSQSLFSTKISSHNSAITLRYTGSAYSTGSYSGSIIDPYYQYAYLDFYPNLIAQPTLSASIYLPFFDGEWWSVMAKKTGTGASTNFELYSGNKMYDGGENGTSIGFFDSSLVIANDTNYNLSTNALFGSGSITVNSKIYNKFSGSFQEIRYYSKPISESVFKDYIMNPSSIEGNSLNSGADQLAFRLPLGNELYTGSNSIHPKVTGSWVTTSSFASNSTASFDSTPTFAPNTEYFYYDQPIAGIKNAIADKIRIENNVIPEGDVLSPFMSLSQQANISQSYTSNTNLLEVSFSPQDKINDDINSSLGYFNIGEYIGDPRLRSSPAESYPDLDALRNSYFEKYTKNYDLVDFVRLIKFFDNSLFKMIKDFVPARTSLASGIVIKQHILERNKIPQPQVDTQSTLAYFSSFNPPQFSDAFSEAFLSTFSFSINQTLNNLPFIFQNILVSGTLAPQWNNFNLGTVENFGGGTAGSFEIYNSLSTSPSGTLGTGPNNIFNITQSWSEPIKTPSGSINLIHNSQDEFYNGEFKGSTLVITTQILHSPLPNSDIIFNYTPVNYSSPNYNEASSSIFAQTLFLNPLTIPKIGEILLLTSPTTNGATYVKIHKTDNNGVYNDIALGQATKLRFKYDENISYSIIGDILEIIDLETYFLYKVQSLGSSVLDNYVLNYSFSASNYPTITIDSATSSFVLKNFGSISGNTESFFTNISGSYITPQTSNIRLTVSASFNSTGTTVPTDIIKLVSTNNGIIAQTPITNGASQITLITSSYFPLGTDTLSLVMDKTSETSLTINDCSFLVTQSISPSPSESNFTLIEPYIAESNFYNSDNNALLNSVNEQRESTFALDVDYSNGITPTNFALLISGTATPSTTPDSNYTSKKSTILKYEGSKSTSQFLNKWTYGDIGTNGKIPTIKSLKTAIAYCDTINSITPEKENSSVMNVLYLIKSDGTVVIPNTTEDSLSIIQQIFLTNEKIFISTKNVEIAPVNPVRTIIRGGSHIEPLLHTQSGSLSNLSFNTTMSFEDTISSISGSVGNYAALYTTTSSINLSDSETIIPLTNEIYGTPISTGNSYNITAPSIQDGVTLTFRLKTNLIIFLDGKFNFTILLKLYKNSITTLPINQSIIGPYQTQELNSNIFNQNGFNTFTKDLVLETTIDNSDLIVDDKIFATIQVLYNGVQTTPSILNLTSLQIYQSPISFSPVTSSGIDSIWGYGNKNTHPYIITSSNSTLVQAYNTNAKQKDIISSSFNSIQLPWKINTGDEFKFEGREDFSFMVKKVYSSEEGIGSGRVFQTGSLEVHFNTNLPVSASSDVFNLDHFLIRRYVDDAAQNVIKGFKPLGSTGPYLVKPEFVVPELDKSIDEIILNLTQKGLIT